MAVLAAHPGSTGTQMDDLTGLGRMPVSRALAGPKRYKRVQRHDDPTDQRRSRLCLRAAGKALVDIVGARAALREAELFAAVSADERVRPDATLDKLSASVGPLTAGGAGSAARTPR